MLFFFAENESEEKKIIIRNKNKTKRRYTNKSPLDSSFIRLHIYTHFYNKHRLLCFVIKMNLIIDSNRVLIVKKKRRKKHIEIVSLESFPCNWCFSFLLLSSNFFKKQVRMVGYFSLWRLLTSLKIKTQKWIKSFCLLLDFAPFSQTSRCERKRKKNRGVKRQVNSYRRLRECVCVSSWTKKRNDESQNIVAWEYKFQRVDSSLLFSLKSLP